MLFNSYTFIFGLLPIAIGGFFLLAVYSRRMAAFWLFAISLVFYGWWNPIYVGLLLASIVFNYATGMILAERIQAGESRGAEAILVLGVTVNLLLLGYFKYANFFVNNVNAVTHLHLRLSEITLPLGISFFTFTQLAFLIDCYAGDVREYNFIHYGLFVTYFPHLIAGPIIHHKEMMPQFDDPATYRPTSESVSIGLTVFFIGLFKKVIFADGVAPHADALFRTVAGGVTPSFLECWAGMLAYALQIYFDFSGYSDMAIGLSRIFGIRLPLNFDSPYKASNIIDFWQRWHITLSRFLRDYYIYSALSTPRRGRARQYANLISTMFLVGLWHGANWTFLIWGTLHGIYLAINHGWHALRRAIGLDKPMGWIGRGAGRTTTFLAVVLAWVFFRADTLTESLKIEKTMLGFNGIVLQPGWLGALRGVGRWLTHHGVRAGTLAVYPDKIPLTLTLALLLTIAWFLPNTQELIPQARPEPTSTEKQTPQPSRLVWSPASRGWAIASGIIAAIALIAVRNVSPFIYFNF